MDRIEMIKALHAILDYEMEQLMRDLEASVPQSVNEEN
jgi:DNA-binding transcriptional regulator WhiA